MNGQPITARTGIKTKLVITLACLAAATRAEPDRTLLPPLPGLDAPPAMRLAVQLYRDGNWSAARTEFRRVRKSTPDHAAAELLCVMTEVRLGMAPTNELHALCISNRLTDDMRAVARCELGDVLLEQGRTAQAIEQFGLVFLSTRTPLLFRRSGRSLTRIVDAHPELGRDAPQLVNQLRSCSGQWRRRPAPPETRAASPRTAWTGLPMEWAVWLYRSQISPAIGRRCSLTPSCSEYALQALRRHGALGLAIYGDRAVREPDVVSNKKDPTPVGGRRYYRDTLEEHDFWITGE